MTAHLRCDAWWVNAVLFWSYFGLLLVLFWSCCSITTHEKMWCVMSDCPNLVLFWSCFGLIATMTTNWKMWRVFSDLSQISCVFILNPDKYLWETRSGQINLQRGSTYFTVSCFKAHISLMVYQRYSNLHVLIAFYNFINLFGFLLLRSTRTCCCQLAKFNIIIKTVLFLISTLHPVKGNVILQTPINQLFWWQFLVPRLKVPSEKLLLQLHQFVQE
jgi:hypothetical protein